MSDITTIEMKFDTIVIIPRGLRPRSVSTVATSGYGFTVRDYTADYIGGTERLYRQRGTLILDIEAIALDENLFKVQYAEIISEITGVPFKRLDGCKFYRAEIDFMGMTHASFTEHPCTALMLKQAKAEYGDSRVDFTAGGPWVRMRVREYFDSTIGHRPGKSQYTFSSFIGEAELDVDVFYIYSPAEADTNSAEDYSMEEVYLKGTETEVSDILSEEIRDRLEEEMVDHYRNLPEDDYDE